MVSYCNICDNELQNLEKLERKQNDIHSNHL